MDDSLAAVVGGSVCQLRRQGTERRHQLQDWAHVSHDCLFLAERPCFPRRYRVRCHRRSCRRLRG